LTNAEGENRYYAPREGLSTRSAADARGLSTTLSTDANSPARNHLREDCLTYGRPNLTQMSKTVREAGQSVKSGAAKRVNTYKTAAPERRSRIGRVLASRPGRVGAAGGGGRRPPGPAPRQAQIRAPDPVGRRRGMAEGRNARAVRRPCGHRPHGRALERRTPDYHAAIAAARARVSSLVLITGLEWKRRPAKDRITSRFFCRMGWTRPRSPQSSNVVSTIWIKRARSLSWPRRRFAGCGRRHPRPNGLSCS
jgi:hypothetical protein